MIVEFLDPISNEIIHFVKQLSAQHLGKKIVLHTDKEMPDLDKIQIAIIGVKENRGRSQTNETINLNYIRKELYALYPGNWSQTIGDLGDILPGSDINDSYFALKELCTSLIKKKIIPIIIGGTQDLTYPMYRAYDGLEQMVNLVSIDNKFDFGKEDNLLSSQSYLTKIIIDEPNNLFNFSNIGFQYYFNSQEEIDLIEKLYFDAYRLGEISNNISLSEPIFRDADLISIDLESVASSFSGNFENFMPNGFNGKEICALSRYAGISDKVSSLGIFNHNSKPQESILIAQIIWYFIEGYHFRSNEYPFTSKENYIKYIVLIDNDEINFYKSNKTERWWIEVKNTTRDKIIKSNLMPCTHDDYLAACNQEIPERWWKAQRKNSI